MSVPSSHNEPSKKRERSSSLTINSAVKKSKIDDIFNSPVKEDDVSKLRICDDIVALWTHSTKGMHSPTGEYSDYEEEDEYDMGDTIFDRHSLRDKPSRRSLLSELLSSSDVAQADTYIYKKRKSALVHSSLFGIDEEDEDEKTTIPKPTEYDEVDAFFSQYTPIEEEKSEINTYNRLGFISPGPHFLTEEYFNTHGPNEKMIPPHNITTTPFLDTDFSIMGRIDSGHYAEVYKARDLSTHQLCAIKKSKLPFKSWDDRWLQLIEVSNMRYIKDSKHCLKMFNAWEEEGYLHIQLELCSTGSLEKYIIYKQRHISEDIVLKIFYELVLGLKDIHEANLAHLDIKPSNILIDDEGSIKISDFGISIRTPVDAKWIKGEGDRTYMAPDLLREEFDKPADIFSLGLVILELATGLVLPETDEPWESLRLGDFSNQDAALSRLSPDLEKLIRWLLITDSADRPTVHDIIKSSYFKSIETSDANEIGTADIMKYVNEVRRLAIEEATRLEHQNIYSTPEHKGSKLPLFSIPL